MRQLRQYADDLGRRDDLPRQSARHKAATYLLLIVDSRQREGAGDDAEPDERLVRHELGRGEGGERVQQQVGALLEVADGQAVQALVRFQPIAPVPVAAILDEPARSARSHMRPPHSFALAMFETVNA